MTLYERLHGPSQMPQDTRCSEEWAQTRCELPAGHVEAFHRAGERTWGFADNATPEWLRRARISDLLLKDFTGSGGPL